MNKQLIRCLALAVLVASGWVSAKASAASDSARQLSQASFQVPLLTDKAPVKEAAIAAWLSTQLPLGDGVQEADEMLAKSKRGSRSRRYRYQKKRNPNPQKKAKKGKATPDKGKKAKKQKKQKKKK